jgi:hypothetical protein
MSLLVTAAGATYLLLHLGPSLRFAYGASIRAGTRWPFFASEVALFLAWGAFVPAIGDSGIGRLAMALHIATHGGYALADAFAHDKLLALALADRRSAPISWVVKEVGLLLDTATHVLAVGLAVMALSPAGVVALIAAAVGGYLWITSAYVRGFARGI